MAKFFVGQRVRILYSKGWPELAGEEGRIVDVSDDPGIEGNSEWRVAPDCWESDRAPVAGVSGARRFGPSSRQLSPILPDGHRPAEYSFTELMDRCREGVAV